MSPESAPFPTSERPGSSSDGLAALRARLRYPDKPNPLVLAGVPLTVHNVADPDSLIDLIDDEEFQKDERMPYWAELWPAALGLAEHLLAQRPLRGACVELGAGVGLCSVAAALAGADVLATDYFPEALDFVALNAAQSGVTVATQLLDFREPDLPRRYDLVLASDVLYERRNHQPVLAALLRLLAPTGIAYVSDPQRPTARAFIDMLDDSPLQRTTTTVTVAQKTGPVPVDLHALRWR